MGSSTGSTGSAGAVSCTRRAVLKTAPLALSLGPGVLSAGQTSCESPASATAEGAPRRYWLLEITRRATVTLHDALVAEQGGCRYRVNAAGDFWGDHWGWCDDFQLLPPWSPGYLVATTIFDGATTGGYSRLHVLPRLPATLDVFSLRTLVDRTSAGSLQLALGQWRVEVPAGQLAFLGAGEATEAMVEGPDEAGHVGDIDPRPVRAQVIYAVHNYGEFDSRRIGGRRAVRP